MEKGKLINRALKDGFTLVVVLMVFFVVLKLDNHMAQLRWASPQSEGEILSSSCPAYSKDIYVSELNSCPFRENRGKSLAQASIDETGFVVVTFSDQPGIYLVYVFTPSESQPGHYQVTVMTVNDNEEEDIEDQAEEVIDRNLI